MELADDGNSIGIDELSNLFEISGLDLVASQAKYPLPNHKYSELEEIERRLFPLFSNSKLYGKNSSYNVSENGYLVLASMLIHTYWKNPSRKKP
ncbi:MAG: hypothetical protein QM811_05945 [Pirellulales bacterium]